MPIISDSVSNIDIVSNIVAMYSVSFIIIGE
jgi:hypothetical protein